MRITEIAVRRLKSFGDYSNVAVELRAALGPNDDVDTVYEALLTKVEELIELSRDLERAEAVAREVERRRAELRSEVEALERALEEYTGAVEELRRVRDELVRALEEARRALSAKGSLLERLRSAVRGGG